MLLQKETQFFVRPTQLHCLFKGLILFLFVLVIHTFFLSLFSCVIFLLCINIFWNYTITQITLMIVMYQIALHSFYIFCKITVSLFSSYALDNFISWKVLAAKELDVLFTWDYCQRVWKMQSIFLPCCLSSQSCQSCLLWRTVYSARASSLKVGQQLREHS